MLGPTTWAVEKRGSATVNVSGSRSTSSAAARPVTTNPPIAGTHATGATARRRARCGCGVTGEVLERDARRATGAHRIETVRAQDRVVIDA